MGQYVYTIAVGAVFAAVVIFLSPGGEGGKLTKHIAFIGALAVALTMLSPLAALISKGDAFSFERSRQYQKSENTKEYCEYYANSAGMALYEMFGTDTDKIKAQVTVSDSGELEKITLNVKEKVYYSTEEAAKALSEIYGINIEVKDGSDGN